MSLLDRSTFLVKEHVGFMKLIDRFDIIDVETGEKIGLAEERISGFIKLLRLMINKRLLPTTVAVTDGEDGELLFTIDRSFSLLRHGVSVTTADGTLLGTFKSKLFSIGGGFLLFDGKGQQVGDVKGDWKGWNFRLIAANGVELGTVTKKWAGMAKELFTSADNYVIHLADEIGSNRALATLLLAAGLAIDIVFKERN